MKKTPPVVPEDLEERIFSMLPLSAHAMATQFSPRLKKSIEEGQLFKTRADNNIRETYVLVSVTSPPTDKAKWFAILSKSYKQEFLLRPITSPPKHEKGELVALRNRLFSIGSTTEVIAFNYTSKIQERSYLNAVHNKPKVAGVCNKLYIFGGVSKEDADCYVEALDLSTQKWEKVPVPEEERMLIPLNCDQVVLNNCVYFLHKNTCVALNPQSGKIEKEYENFGEKKFDTSCVIGNKLFALDWEAKITVYDSPNRLWRPLKGLENIPSFGLFTAALISFNGKLLVLQQTPQDISLTVIAIEERGQDIWGRLESSNSGLILQEPTTRIQEILSVEI
ncbi:unnamed protein product [Arabis nemorensis]|uniref:FKB95-like N-terminal Kelch domain-containing protein n=1 Tax=Arabis nemorensis TaxID=586526 RepID=A0A565BEC1_9BRAS|nr:unnamed protein product [Arabis nemorensis]